MIAIDRMTIISISFFQIFSQSYAPSFWLRRRKGLHVEDKAVQSATKQRTLARKK